MSDADNTIWRYSLAGAPKINPDTGLPDSLYVNVQNGYIMDWTPTLSFTTLDLWQFATDQLAGLCPKRVCP